MWKQRYELRWLAPLVLAGILGPHMLLVLLLVENYRIESEKEFEMELLGKMDLLDKMELICKMEPLDKMELLDKMLLL